MGGILSGLPIQTQPAGRSAIVNGVRATWARAMWTLFEPIHAVIYFSPAARAAYESAGLRGFWRGYFAGRAAPLGPVPPAAVVAAFFSFAPQMVERAIPEVWHLAGPERALEARMRGAVASLHPLAGAVSGYELKEAANLMEAAVDLLDPAR